MFTTGIEYRRSFITSQKASIDSFRLARRSQDPEKNSNFFDRFRCECVLETQHRSTESPSVHADRFGKSVKRVIKNNKIDELALNLTNKKQAMRKYFQ